MGTVGVLALQGAFSCHAAMLRTLSHRAVPVRAPQDLSGLDGLILPGGESTSQLSLIDRLGLEPALHAFVKDDRPILATCAGAILAACEVSNPRQRSYGWIDVKVERNAYGRQIASFEAESDEIERFPFVFIRAPRIVRHGPSVEILARYRGEPVLVQQRRVTCATYHPELTGDARVHAAVFGRC
jgi:5'-phosphate synthase pdxT subunit